MAPRKKRSPSPRRFSPTNAQLAAAGVGTALLGGAAALAMRAKRRRERQAEAEMLEKTFIEFDKRFETIADAIRKRPHIAQKVEEFSRLVIAAIENMRKMIKIQLDVLSLKTTITQEAISDAKKLAADMLTELQALNDKILKPSPRSEFKCDIYKRSNNALRANAKVLIQNTKRLVDDLRKHEEYRLLVLNPDAIISDLERLIKRAENFVLESESTLFRRSGMINFLCEMMRIFGDYRKIFP